MAIIHTPAEIMSFVKDGVAAFLSSHPDEVFSAFAFDCNVEEGGELNLCLTTREHELSTLDECRSGEYGAKYQDDAACRALKYNTGDWQYQCFDTFYCIDDDPQHDYFVDVEEDEYKARCAMWINVLAQTMVEFIKEPEFARIPKSDNFKVLVLDHEEDVQNSERRLRSLQDNPMFVLD